MSELRRTARPTWRLLGAAVALLGALPACSCCIEGGTAKPVGVDAGGDTTPPNENCQPLVGTECLSVVPSFFWSKPDLSSPTGARIDLPASAMPVSLAGVALDPAEWNRRDGFSNAMPTVILLPTPPDTSKLADEAHSERSLAADSPTWMLDLTTGQRLRHIAELDLNAKDPKRQALILRPWTVPPAGHRIGVALTRYLVDQAGKPYPRTAAMQALMDGKPTGYMRLEGQRGDWLATWYAFGKVGLLAPDIQAVWHYQTASKAWTTGALEQMRTATMAQTSPTPLGITLDTAEIDPKYSAYLPMLSPAMSSVKVTIAPLHPDIALRIKGTYEVPLFLTGTGPEARLNWSGTGAQVAQNGKAWRPFTMVVPPSALTAASAPRLGLYGHGFLRGACVEMCHGIGTAEFVTHFAAAAGVVLAGTDWWGLAQTDLGTALAVVQDFNKAPQLTEKLVQAAIGPLALSRALQGTLASDVRLRVKMSSGASRPLFDATADLVYYGNSLGGIMGTTMAAVHPDLKRAVMNVAAGVWSTMMNRSSNFNTFLELMGQSLPDPFQQQVVLALLQSQWDLSDPIQFARHVVAEPFAGSVPGRKALWPVSWGDSQVPNLGSGMLARASGAALLTPALAAWEGAASDASQAKGLPFAGDQSVVQWDSHRGNHPTGNALPWPDNGAHYATRWMPEFQQMVYRFLWGDGKVEQRYCLGRDKDGKLPCDLEQPIPSTLAEEPTAAVLPPPDIP
ncbi:MAG: hypothetical protein HY902_11060 [Deltaproteobacteria bacterium]|nr:hypothetical protein [Deltaproteobacteria bacterium]